MTTTLGFILNSKGSLYFLIGKCLVVEHYIKLCLC